MPKVIDPNHLALMSAARLAIEHLRLIHSTLTYRLEDGQPPSNDDLRQLAAVMDRLRLTLKGRIGRFGS